MQYQTGIKTIILIRIITTLFIIRTSNAYPQSVVQFFHLSSIFTINICIPLIHIRFIIMTVTVFIIGKRLSMAQTETQGISFRKLLLINSLPNQRIFISQYIIINISQQLILQTFLIQTAWFFLIISTDHIEYQKLLIFQSLLIIKIQRRTRPTFFSTVYHIHLIIRIGNISQYSLIIPMRLAITSQTKSSTEQWIFGLLQIIIHT